MEVVSSRFDENRQEREGRVRDAFIIATGTAGRGARPGSDRRTGPGGRKGANAVRPASGFPGRVCAARDRPGSRAPGGAWGGTLLRRAASAFSPAATAHLYRGHPLAPAIGLLRAPQRLFLRE